MVRVKAKNPKGKEGDMSSQSSYGFEEHARRCRFSNVHRLRTTRIAQPRTLKFGDTLGTGDRVLEEPTEGTNGMINICISGGPNGKGKWVEVSAEIPIALLVSEDNAPHEIVQDLPS